MNRLASTQFNSLRLYLENSPPPLGWIYRNLLSSPLNIFLTLCAVWIIYISLSAILSWAFINADWIGTSGEECTSGGACWIFIKENINFLVYGFYPQDQLWRPNMAALLCLLLVAGLFIPQLPVHFKLYLGGFILFIYPFIAYVFIHGSLFGISFLAPVVPTSRWGGLMLTIVLASVGMVASFPLGILLALGRRSTTMPSVKMVCIMFIEFWRGVPLITILFMASVMLPLFFPQGTNFDKLARALVGITLFQAAYMAEVIRGGLQAIPQGQYEAADALGLSYWKKVFFIILPQALKLVIPGIVNTFIALFKDTSLVYIIGMWDLLHTSYGATRNPEWLKYAIEAFAFAAFIYWIFCFAMSRYSQAIEKRFQHSHKK